MRHAHVLGTVRGCAVRTADDLRERMLAVATRCRFRVRGECFVQFEPEGATGVMVLAESHWAAHTFPEEGTVRCDVYCCASDFDPDECIRAIKAAFGDDGEWRVIER
jgi:hypothetical protein